MNGTAMVAKEERGKISACTKAALAVAKARGETLGGFRGFAVPDEARALSAVSRGAANASRAADSMPVVGELRAAGAVSLWEANGLDDCGIPTARGGSWSAVQV